MFRNVGELSIIFSSSYRLKFMRSLMSLMLYDFTYISDHMLLLRSQVASVCDSPQLERSFIESAPNAVQSHRADAFNPQIALQIKWTASFRIARCGSAAESSETLSDDFAVSSRHHVTYMNGRRLTGTSQFEKSANENPSSIVLSKKILGISFLA